MDFRFDSGTSDPTLPRTWAYAVIEILLVAVLVLCLVGAPYGYVRRVDWGYAPSGLFTLVFVFLLVLLLTGWRP